MTHAMRFTSFGTPDVLSLVEEALPQPGPDEVRVRVEASSVQYTDTLIRRGLYPEIRGPLPLTPGYDLVGVVDAIGANVTAWSPGDRVADLCKVGGNAAHAIRPSDSLVAVPEDVDAAEAATLVLSWVTAYQALVRFGELKAGERFLMVGGTGAVGLAAIVIAKQLGAEVYATGRADSHHTLRAMGAHPLPRDGWQAEIAAIGGVDVVIDGVAVDAYRSSYRALRSGGRLVPIGMSALANQRRLLGVILAFTRLALWRLWPWTHRARFYSITDERRSDPDAFREDLGTLFGWLRDGRIRPAVARRISFSDVAGVHGQLEEGGLTGKVVLLPQGP